MNSLILAVFAACAVLVNGQQEQYSNEPSSEEEQNGKNATYELGEDVAEESRFSSMGNFTHNGQINDKLMKFFPQYLMPGAGLISTHNMLGRPFGKFVSAAANQQHINSMTGLQPMNQQSIKTIFNSLTGNQQSINTIFSHSPGNQQSINTIFSQAPSHQQTINSIFRPPPANQQQMNTITSPGMNTFTSPFTKTTSFSFSKHWPLFGNSQTTTITTPLPLPLPMAREPEIMFATAEAAKQKKKNAVSSTKPTRTTTTERPYSAYASASASASASATVTVNRTESSCQTPSGGAGECISVFNCQVLLDLVNKKDRSTQDINLLKQSQCGYIGSSPAVCCPREVQEGSCQTPEGNAGKCISLYSCSHLANMLRPPVPSENIAYVQRSRCTGTDQYSVCCGPPPGPIEPVAPGNCEAKMTAFPPDPRTECCGVDSRVGNKIVGGNATTVDQYPWLVMIEYVKQGATKLLCGGTLISGKYVLTAGHCVAGQVLDIGTPRRVRLGEYDISHEGQDCTPVEAGGQDCTDGVTRINIEKTIPHPQYNPVSPLKRNDIALLRLAQNAPFTDFIRPICLPSKDFTLPQNTPINFTLFAAGWGAVSTRQSYSNVKLHVDLPYVEQSKCQPAYSLPGRSVTLWKGQMCAGGQPGKDSCKGDSGGPLMYEDGRTYEIIGVVSFGPVPCGMEGIPGVYSKVYEYLDWIRSTITA